MEANEMAIQPLQDQNNQMKEEKMPSEDTLSSSEEEQPMQKSGVTVDLNAVMQGKKFKVNDVVHMSVVEHGIRTKGIYTVAKVGYNKEGAYPQYQLTDKEGRTGSAWVRENKLKLQKRG
ncbi:hypothetical protein P280DRAFT_236811 [Massarina eburnea CBS 473.64]|uniref:Uncharacterized protein n=1 Tax=Massarina eburnea CBS 473.64 TaxID=1395130 RepID=A0A6A6RKP9_9PLEO|nr:hypothetical protein P280DRAFT_236811 [Massarina eburnea CBS 473.64]